MSGWTYLIVAGLFEIGFTTCMKLSEGFSKWNYVVGFLFFATLSFAALNRSLTEVPLGTAYAIWTGIGAFGTALVGIVFFGDPANGLRIALLLLLVASIVGLKFIA